MYLIVDFDLKYSKHFAAPCRVRGEHGYLASIVCALDAHLGTCRSSSVHLSVKLSDLNTVGECVPIEFAPYPVRHSTMLGVL